MTNDLSLDYLKVFYLVASSGNITRVAEQLYISQSAITQKLKKLEEIIGYAVFFRTTKGVELTDYGKELYSRLKPVFSSLEAVYLYLDNLNNLKTGEIKICCGTNLAKRVLVEPIVSFGNDYHNIKICQLDYPFDTAVELLQSAKIDLFVSQKDENMVQNFNFLPIFTEKYIFVCSKDYYSNEFNLSNKQVYIVQKNGSMSRRIFDDYMLKFNLTFDNNIEVVGYNMMVELCKKNMGIIMVPSYIVEEELKAGELIDLKYKNLPTIDYGLYSNKFVKNAIVEKFLKII